MQAENRTENRTENQIESLASQTAGEQAVENRQEIATAKPKSRRCGWILAAIALILALPTLWLASGTGQRQSLQFLVNQLDGLSIGKVEGSLQEGLTLQDARYQQAGIDVQLGQATLQIGFHCLWQKKACVENVALKNAQIAIDTTQLPPSTPSESQPLGEISLPIGISLQQLELENVQVKVDEMAIALDHFQSGVQGSGNQLRLLPTQLTGLTLTLPQAVQSPEKSVQTPKKSAAAGKSATAEKSEKPTASPIDWAALKQQLAQPLLSKQAPIKLPLQLDLPEINAKNIHIRQQISAEKSEELIHIEQLSLAAKADLNAVRLTKLVLDSDKGKLRGEGELKLAENYPLAWRLHANTPELKAFGLPASQADLTLSGELFGKTQLNLATQGAVAAKIDGEVQLSQPKTPLALRIQSALLRYPFIEEKGSDPLKLSNVDLSLKGDLLDYQLNGKLAMAGMQLPAGDLHLAGKGGLTQFDLQHLTLNVLNGKSDLNGKLAWENGVEWQSALALENIHTAPLLPEWAAVLSGGLQSNGYAARGANQQEWAVSVRGLDLHGSLLQKKLQLKGELNASHQQLLNVPAATLIYGENRLALNGVLGEQSNFHAQIDAPNLQGLVPNFNAKVQGNVQLKGKVSEPDLLLDLNAQQLRYDQLALQQLTAKGNIRTDKTIQGELALALRGFKQGEVAINEAQLAISGSEADHQLKLTAKGEPIGAALQLSGKFERSSQQWQGQLANVQIQSPVGAWQNDKTVAISYDHKRIQTEIAAHCWQNPKLNLCFPQRFQAGKEGKVPFEIKAFDLSLLQPFLGKESELSGVVNAQGEAAWFSQKAPQVNLNLHSNGIKFSQKIDYRHFPIELAPVKISANLADNQLKLKTELQTAHHGSLRSDLQMKDLTGSRSLSGEVQIDKLNLALIKPLLTNGETVTGEIGARLKLGGNVAAPQLFGNLNLTGLTAKAPIMPFDVVGGGLRLDFHGASSNLTGNLKTKESELRLEGNANWQKLEAWHTQVRAQAERFRLDIPNIAKVEVSPNIEVKATAKELLLSGKIDIPWARVAVEELPESAVSVSADEVIMEGSPKQKIANKIKALPQTLPQQSSSGMAIKADVSINIGKDVKLDAYGLKTDLNGTLKVRQGSKGLGLYGQVNLKNGTFASFGQDLVVRKGLISFTGLPSQPTLDIEAIRNPEAIEDASVVAGVRVTGIADKPDVKLFSSPSMSQDQILSYILTGRALESSGGSSSNSIAAALIGMSLSKSSKMVGGVGSAFGIKDLNVTTAGIGDNTKVVVSGSFTPRFQVKYGVGLFAPLTELTLRYRLAPSLYLQWISSVNQAVDLLYRFEFD